MNANERFHNRVISETKAGKSRSMAKAIRAFCLECMGYNAAEVRACPSKDTCPLWHFRFGTGHGRPKGTPKK